MITQISKSVSMNAVFDESQTELFGKSLAHQNGHAAVVIC